MKHYLLGEEKFAPWAGRKNWLTMGFLRDLNMGVKNIYKRGCALIFARLNVA
jgi:hypothetical protein